MKTYTIQSERYNPQLDTTRTYETTGTLQELIEAFAYTLECGHAYQHECGAHKINLRPKTAKSLVDNLNRAEENRMANGCANVYYNLV